MDDRPASLAAYKAQPLCEWAWMIDHISFAYAEKVELFLEVFGNSLVRSQTADYVRVSADQLIKWDSRCVLLMYNTS